MSRAAEKAERERCVFQKFVWMSKLPIVPESVESRPPPEPDILSWMERKATSLLNWSKFARRDWHANCQR